jgi:putative endonuclease
MSNISRMLYLGVTSNLHQRVHQHKNKLVAGFSQRYNLHRLVYCEPFGDIRAAIIREKELKGWLRSKKLALIDAANPGWNDLAADWFKPPKAPTRINTSVTETSSAASEKNPPPLKARHPEATRRG